MKRRGDRRAPRARRRGWGRRLPRLLPILLLLPLVVGVRDFRDWLRTGDLLRVTSVEIEGASLLSARELDALRGVAPGTSLWAIDPAGVGRELRRHPWVREATVGRIPPDQVIVRLEERQPVAFVLTEGELIPVDIEGVLLPPRPAVMRRDLPLITGVKIPRPVPWGELIPETAWGTAVLFLRELECERRGGDGRGLEVAELHLDEAKRELTVVEVGDRLIRFSFGRLAARMTELFAVLEELERRDLAAGVVDLRFRDQVVVRRVRSRDADEISPLEGGDAG